MAKRDVTLVMNGKQAGLVQAWLDSQKSVKNFEKAVQDAGQTGQDAGKKSNRSFGGLLLTMGKSILRLQAMSVALGVVRSVAGAAFRDLEKVRDVGKQALTAQLSFAQQLQLIGLSSGDNANMTAAQLEKMIKQNRSGMSDADEALLVGTAISAGSGPDIRSRARIGLEAANQMAGVDTEIQTIFTEQAVKAQERFPNTTTAEQIAIFWAALGASSAGPTNVVQFGENTLAGANKLGGFGASQAFALQSLISVGNTSGDTQGAKTFTSMSNTFRTMRAEAIRSGIGDESIEDIRNRMITAGPDGRIADKIGQEISGRILGGMNKEMRAILQKKASLGDSPSDRELFGSLSVRSTNINSIIEWLSVGENLTKTKFKEAAGDINFASATETFARKKAEFAETEASKVQSVKLGLGQVDAETRGAPEAIQEQLLQFMETVPGISKTIGDSLVKDFLVKVKQIQGFGKDKTTKELLIEFQKFAMNEARRAAPRDVKVEKTSHFAGAGASPAIRKTLKGIRDTRAFAKTTAEGAQLAATMIRLADAMEELVNKMPARQAPPADEAGARGAGK